MRELNTKEIKNVNGGAIGNIFGAFAGAIGGGYGAIIAGGRNTSGMDIARGAFSGFTAGALNPVRGFGSLAGSLLGGAAGGGASRLIGEVLLRK